MDHSKRTCLRPNELNASNVEGANMYGSDVKDIGNVTHFHGTGQSAQAVVDVGGFLGLGANPVALETSSLVFMSDEDGKIQSTTIMTKDELKNSPNY